MVLLNEKGVLRLYRDVDTVLTKVTPLVHFLVSWLMITPVIGLFSAGCTLCSFLFFGLHYPFYYFFSRIWIGYNLVNPFWSFVVIKFTEIGGDNSLEIMDKYEFDVEDYYMLKMMIRFMASNIKLSVGEPLSFPQVIFDFVGYVLKLNLSAFLTMSLIFRDSWYHRGVGVLTITFVVFVIELLIYLSYFVYRWGDTWEFRLFVDALPLRHTTVTPTG